MSNELPGYDAWLEGRKTNDDERTTKVTLVKTISVTCEVDVPCDDEGRYEAKDAWALWNEKDAVSEVSGREIE